MTLAPLLPQQDFGYSGERGDWLVALTQHRDSDTLERSNWEVITEDLLHRFDGEDIAIERFGHWAVGWTEALLVRPGSPAADAATGWAARLANYGIADEEHYSMLEHDEEWCDRCDRGTRGQHPLVGCHKFRSLEDEDEIRYAWRHRHDFRK